MNHIATGRALSLGENYSHMVMVSTLDGEVDEEVQPGVEAAAHSSHGAAAAASGGGGPRGRRPLAPFFFLGDGAAMEELLPLLGGCQEEENSWLFFWSSRPRVSFFIWTLGFPSPPFRLPPNRAYRPRPNSDWADLRLKIFVWKIVTTFSLI